MRSSELLHASSGAWRKGEPEAVSLPIARVDNPSMALSGTSFSVCSNLAACAPHVYLSCRSISILLICMAGTNVLTSGIFSLQL